MLMFLFGVLSGTTLPIQTSVNQGFREKAKSPYLATLVSTVGGLIIVSALLLLRGEGLSVSWGYAASEPWWIWTGGIWGFFLATFNVLALPKIGSVQTVIFCVLGQIVSGLLIDNFGWLKAEVIALTPLRALGAALVFAGVMLVSLVGKAAEGEKTAASGKLWLYRFLATMSGVFIGVQLAVNGYLSLVIGSSYKSTFVSLLGAMLFTSAVCLMLKVCGRLFEEKPEPIREINWWRWTPGLFGFISIWANVLLANAFGMGLAVIISLIGQIAGSMVIDRVGFLGIKKQPITLRKVAGLLVMLGGAALIKLL